MASSPTPVSFVVLAPLGLDANARASLASARAQDYPQYEPEVLIARSLDEALEQTTGELLAFLRAGETWAPGKTSLQVPLLDGRPEVGLVYGDSDPSSFARRPARCGRALGHLLTGPLAPPSSLLVRADVARAALRPDLLPPCPFWWLTIRAAELGEVDAVEDVVCTSSGEAPDAPTFRRSLLARMTPGTVPVGLLLDALAALPELPRLGDGAPDRKQASVAVALRRPKLAAAHLVRALALDPTDAAARAELDALTRTDVLAA